MRIGVAKEIKPDEYRVALTPAGALELINRGHEVTVETDAGAGSSFPDAAYERIGARIGPVDEVWGSSELLLKVKEPIAAEYGRLREGLTLFTYLHIAADEPLTRALVDSGVTAVAYETVETRAARCRCSRRCRRSRGGSRRRRAPTSSRSRSAAAGSCSAACPASRRGAS